MNGRIKAIRVDSGLTQADFGAKIGVSQNYVWMMETGARVPGDRTIRDICREFGVNETWLRTGAGEMRRARSREAELGELIRSRLLDRPESFQAALVTVLLRFDPDGPEFAALEKIARALAEETEKDPEP